mmetsp:Transcript_9023/g.29628  ORF Transcript_9023/g.29628 Transcript_9023/m.29628 type:complete len:233 (+) Transcript_9023:539-1237(+)
MLTAAGRVAVARRSRAPRACSLELARRARPGARAPAHAPGWLPPGALLLLPPRAIGVGHRFLQRRPLRIASSLVAGQIIPFAARGGPRVGGAALRDGLRCEARAGGAADVRAEHRPRRRVPARPPGEGARAGGAAGGGGASKEAQPARGEARAHARGDRPCYSGGRAGGGVPRCARVRSRGGGERAPRRGRRRERCGRHSPRRGRGNTSAASGREGAGRRGADDQRRRRFVE